MRKRKRESVLDSLPPCCFCGNFLKGFLAFPIIQVTFMLNHFSLFIFFYKRLIIQTGRMATEKPFCTTLTGRTDSRQRNTFSHFLSLHLSFSLSIFIMKEKIKRKILIREHFLFSFSSILKEENETEKGNVVLKRLNLESFQVFLKTFLEKIKGSKLLP